MAKTRWNYSYIFKQIEKHKCVSFDIFDTLIKRDCYSPHDVFTFIERDEQCCIENFTERRIEAERKARSQSLREEVSLDEIYRCFPNSILQADIECMKGLELRYEYTLCQLNPEVEPVLSYLRTHHKIVAVTSDMYLPEDFVMKLLSKCQINYDNLYLSSKYYKTKRTGTLYKELLAGIKLEPKDVFHIGDNYRSDYISARREGIKAACVPTHSQTCWFNDQKEFKRNGEYRSLSQFISNHHKNEKNLFYRTGFEGLGPVLYGFVRWLNVQLADQNINNVFFLARDGQIIKRVFDSCFRTFNTHYFYASRRALIVPTLWKHSELTDIEKRMFWPRVGTINAFIDKIGLDNSKYVKIFRSAGYNPTQLYEYQSLFSDEKFQNIFYFYIRPEMIDNSRKEYHLVNDYINQEGMIGKIAIVDIGWNGNMQLALQDIMGEKIDVYGYYVGLNPESENLTRHRIKAKGYLFDVDHNQENFYRERMFTSIFETLFTADHGTTLKYKRTDEGIVPVLDEWEYSENKDYRKIVIAQKAAVDFCMQSYNEPDFRISWHPEYVFSNLIVLGCHPSKTNAMAWGDMQQLGDTLKYLAKPKTRTYYLTHPKEFYRDLSSTPWRIGFMTLIVGNKIPYYNIYYSIREMKK